MIIGSAARQLKLEKIIRNLSDSELDSEDEVKAAVYGLMDVYLDRKKKMSGFRHQYSRLSSIIFESGGDRNEKVGDWSYFNDRAQVLAVNIDTIWSYIHANIKTILRDVDVETGFKFYDVVGKLHDHINLELLRINYNAISQQEKDESIGLLRSQIDDYGDKLEKQQMKFKEDIEQSQKQMQRNYISILGIFAAVVIAFMSGTAFSSSVLQNIDKVGVFRLTFVVLLVGLFMFLMISSLFMFLNRVSLIGNEKMIIVLKWGTSAFVILMMLVVFAKVVYTLLPYIPYVLASFSIIGAIW